MKERIDIMNDYFIRYKIVMPNSFISVLYEAEYLPRFPLSELKRLCRKAISDHCRTTISDQPYNDEEEEELINEWIKKNLSNE